MLEAKEFRQSLQNIGLIPETTEKNLTLFVVAAIFVLGVESGLVISVDQVRVLERDAGGNFNVRRQSHRFAGKWKPQLNNLGSQTLSETSR